MHSQTISSTVPVVVEAYQTFRWNVAWPADQYNNTKNPIPFTVNSQALKEHIMTCRQNKNDNLPFFNSNHVPLQFPPPHRLPLLTPPSPAMSVSPPIKLERSESTSPRGQSPETHACSQCSASFLSRDLLEKHEILHSPNDSVVSTYYFLNCHFSTEATQNE